MEMMPVSSERKAQLEKYAHRHGQEPVAPLDELLANYSMGAPGLQRNREAALAAYEEVKAGRKKDGLPR